MIETVFSSNSSPSWPEELQRLADSSRREPFAADTVAFVGGLSQRILRSGVARQFPELAALAHWFRPANVRALAERVRGAAGVRVRPRGVVFVIAPANVDVLFMYCWLLSLLAGNATVVRVSRKPSQVRDVFIALTRELLRDPGCAALLADSWVITYDHDASCSRAISARCHARLVWGGDATVGAIRAVPLNPLAIEVAFADRFSAAALDAATVLAQSDASLREVARQFANDTLWFDQQACSSPRAVLWIGDEAQVVQAKARFWDAYRSAAAHFTDSPSSVMARVTDLFSLAAAGSIDRLASPPAQRPALGVGTPMVDAVREIHSGHGLFVEYTIAQATDIAMFVREKDQTLVAYGLGPETLNRLVELLPHRALDRIVAPGQAAEFSTVWDGADLLDVLTRKVGLSA